MDVISEAAAGDGSKARASGASRRGRRYVGVAALVVAPLVLGPLIVAPAAGAVPPVGVACSVSAQSHFSTSSVAGRRLGHLTVDFATSCGYSVRAFYEHPSATGAMTQRGSTVRGTRVKSSVTSTDASYCRYGYERQVGPSWRQTTLSRRGSC